MSSASSFTVTISHPISASDEQEAVYLSRARTLHWIRMGIAFILLAASAGVIGTEADPLHYYNETKNMWLPLWPMNLDIRQTNALLACGVIILFQALVYVFVAALPSPYPRLRTLNLLSSAVGITGLITSITGVAFAIYLPSATYPEGFTVGETLHSWTCKWKSLEGLNATASDGKPLTAPANFSRICTESRAGFILLGLLIGLEVIMCVAAAAGYMLEKTVSRQRKLSNVDEFVMETKQ